MKIKNKKSSVALLLLAVLGLVGATIAYFASSDTFTNIFQTKGYSVVVEETFESPDDWTPGKTTPKTIKATNTGETPVRVRVSYTEKWEDEEEDPLPLTITVGGNTERASIINFTEGWEDHWSIGVEGGTTYYYYKDVLEKDEYTTNLIDSVTFNPNVEGTKTTGCTTNDETHTKTCTTTISGYAGGTYTLTFTVETMQADAAESEWTIPASYKVTFNSNEGSSVASQNIISGRKATEPTAPTKTDYIFDGWYSDSELTTQFDFNTAITAATTLYAKWTASSYTGYVYRFAADSWYLEGDISTKTAGTDYVKDEADVINMNALAANYYLKEGVEEDSVWNHYVVFKYNGDSYSLRGQYEDDEAVLISAFGSENCTEGWYSLVCSAGGLYASIDSENNAQVGASDYSSSCRISFAETSYCLTR